MGLILSKGVDEIVINPETGEEITVLGKSIHIHGTDIELTSVYVRIEFVAHADGTTISVTFNTYLDHAHYVTDDCVNTDINFKGFDFTILETEEQSLAVALQYSILKFEDLGYTAIIE